MMKAGWKQIVAGAFFFAAVCASGAQTVETAPPVHPVTVAQVRQLLEMTHTVENVTFVMHTAVRDQRKLVTVLPDGFWDDFDVEIDKIDWVALSTPYYQKHLSEEDAKVIIAFYSTEVGQRALAMTAQLVPELSQAGRKLGEEIGARLGEKYKAEIEARMKKQQGGSEIQLK